MNYSSVLMNQTTLAFMVWTSDLRPVCNPEITINQLIRQKSLIFLGNCLKMVKYLNRSKQKKLTKLYEILNAAGIKWLIRSSVSAQCNV